MITRTSTSTIATASIASTTSATIVREAIRLTTGVYLSLVTNMRHDLVDMLLLLFVNVVLLLLRVLVLSAMFRVPPFRLIITRDVCLYLHCSFDPSLLPYPCLI